MENSLAPRLLSFARELLKARDLRELLDATQAESLEALGYPHAWLFVGETEEPDELRLVDTSGASQEVVWELVPRLKVAGDRMLEEIVHGNRVVVVEDARVDPRTNKEIVRALGNRTIINVPLRLMDKPFGAMGVGTYGDAEGCRPPTSAQLEHLIGMASQLSVAAARIRMTEERAHAEKEKTEMERRLFQMQKLESLGMLASGIAHDFNNLLTVILGNASIARASSTAGEAGALDTVIEAAERAVKLTKQLMAMSSRQPLTVEPLDLNEHLDRLLHLLKRVMPRNVEVTTTLGQGLHPVRGDASQLDQVFMNLCINARDAMPEGGQLAIATSEVDVEAAQLKLYPWAAAGRHLRVAVSDTGTGITDEVAGRMFDPFFTTKGATGGSGLGLAIAYGIVNRHRGLVKCASAPGSGTTFEVFLPVAQ